MYTIDQLKSQFLDHARVELITIRPERRAIPEIKESVEAVASVGLEGDHYDSKGGKRQVTIIAQEHLKAAASILGKKHIDPLLTRRNIVTTGINLLALKHKKFRIGEAVLEYTGECHPCSRMEENFGKGGYNAMRGHGGITCKIVSSGDISVGDSIVVID
ncbi:molybdenum cofactor sulfurase [Roseivirga misakiensis]|uniref:Molybdenum cofactor sulfurase n=2 Tax=Roseivirga misakiensis TaxID=1563681 RepID=A0A1E5T2B5_9BACT|nr:molybdenum cofactor sulfurase [Roseivirga misakiensis]